MADRYFPNEFPDFVPQEQQTVNKKTSATSSTTTEINDSLINLISLPYNNLSEKFRKSALNLMDTVLKETWQNGGKKVKDFSLYTGALGTAYLLYQGYRVTNNASDLQLCSQIIMACDSACRDSSCVTFICGKAGVYALGAVVAKHTRDEGMLDHYLTQFREIKLPRDLPNELLYGRAGYLWGCLFLNKHIGKDTISSIRMRSVVNDIIKSGRQMATNGQCPLMFEWHGKKYWGAAHGLAGILHVLMHMELKDDEIEDVLGTLRYMINNRFPSGNYPSSEGSESDRLVHWCHGAPGVAITLVKAAEVFGAQDFLQAAIDAGEVVWNRGLLKRVGVCHGISGNTYVFLSLYRLYRLTGDPKYLYRAKAFSCFLLDRAQKLISEKRMAGGDRPYSLFEGIGGMANLFLDMVQPSDAKFPAYEV